MFFAISSLRKFLISTSSPNHKQFQWVRPVADNSKRLSRDEKKLAKKLWEVDNLSAKEIAAQLGISASSIYSMARRNGWLKPGDLPAQQYIETVAPHHAVAHSLHEHAVSSIEELKRTLANDSTSVVSSHIALIRRMRMILDFKIQLVESWYDTSLAAEERAKISLILFPRKGDSLRSAEATLLAWAETLQVMERVSYYLSEKMEHGVSDTYIQQNIVDMRGIMEALAPDEIAAFAQILERIEQSSTIPAQGRGF